MPQSSFFKAIRPETTVAPVDLHDCHFFGGSAFIPDRTAERPLQRVYFVRALIYGHILQCQRAAVVDDIPAVPVRIIILARFFAARKRAVFKRCLAIVLQRRTLMNGIVYFAVPRNGKGAVVDNGIRAAVCKGAAVQVEHDLLPFCNADAFGEIFKQRDRSAVRCFINSRLQGVIIDNAICGFDHGNGVGFFFRNDLTRFIILYIPFCQICVRKIGIETAAGNKRADVLGINLSFKTAGL